MIASPLLPLSFDDESLKVLKESAALLHPRDRGEFLQDVARELKKYGEIGPGLVAKVTRAIVRRHLSNGGNVAAVSAGRARAEREFASTRRESTRAARVS
jgi:hypothetical protein